MPRCPSQLIHYEYLNSANMATDGDTAALSTNSDPA